MESEVAARPAPGIGELFLTFARMGLMGFGGVAPVARHVLVADRRWFTDQEYAALFSLGQVLPGPNIVNASLMIGDRYRGLPGAIAAISGLMVMPLALLVAIATLYAAVVELPVARAAMGGAAAAAAGLVIGLGIKMARKQRPDLAALAFGLAALVGTGILRLPLVLVLAVLAPLSIALAWRRLR